MTASQADGEVFAYDAVAYPTPVLPLQTPDRIGAAGLLHGWVPPDVAQASVLEIGCGTGHNLIGIAAAWPETRCVGFDLSAQAINVGSDLADRAALANVDLHEGDIATYPLYGPKFDYVLCHGVYSWVPVAIRPALLTLIGARLAPGGVAYLSFDALPAAGSKSFINKFLIEHLADTKGLEGKVLAATRLIAMLARNQRPESLLKPQLDMLVRDLQHFDPAYFFHDWLAEHYNPVTLDQFGSEVEVVGLRRAGDPGMSDLYAGDVDREAREMLDACDGDIKARSKLLHMLRGSHVFRREMLVRSDTPPPSLDWREGLKKLSFAYLGRRETGKESGAVSYSDGPRSQMTTADDLTIAVMDHLCALAPGEGTFSELKAATGAEPDHLASVLRNLCNFTHIEAHGSEQNFVLEPGDRPEVSSLTRAMMIEGDNAISLRHVKFMAPHNETRQLLALCDGNRTREDLTAIMQEQFGGNIDRARIDAAISDLARLRLFRR